MGLAEHVKNEWEVLRRAPLAFAILFLSGLGAGFGGAVFLKDQQVAVLEARIESYKEDVARLSKSGASADETWLPGPDFTPDEMQRLKDSLGKQPSYIEVFEGEAASPWTETIKQTFEASGWKVGSFVPDAIFATAEPPVMLRWTDPAASEAIAAAFNAAGISFDISESQGSSEKTLTFWAGDVLRERQPLQKP